MTWQIWAIIGFILLCSELFIPTGFALVLIGLAALSTSVIVALGVTEPVWLPWVIFSVFGGVILYLGKVVFSDRLSQKHPPQSRNELVGAEVTISVAIAPGVIGSGEFRGTTWQIRNETSAVLQSGSRVRVTRVEGLTLIVA